MFKIDPNPQFEADVEINVPGVDEPQTCKGRFRAMTVSQANAFDLTTEKGTEAYLREAVVRLDDIADDAGKAVAFTAELFDHLLDMPWVRMGLLRAHFKGTRVAKQGN